MKVGQKSDKSLIGFMGDLKTPKFHSEINWPLVEMKGESQHSILLQFFHSNLKFPGESAFS